MRRVMTTASAVLVMMCVEGNAFAQQGEDVPLPEPVRLVTEAVEVSLGGERVSLSELQRHAQEHAPRIAVARAQTALAQEDYGAAAPLLPGDGALQVGVGPRFVAQGDSAPNVQVQLLQPIEIAGQRRLRRRVAESATETRDSHLARAQLETVAEVASRFYAAVIARQAASLAEESARLSEQRRDIAERRARIGEASRLIVELAESESVAAQQAALAARQAYREECLAMAELTGWTGLPEPEGDLPTARQVPSLDRLLVLARENNPELRVRHAALEEARRREMLAARDAWAEPQVGFQYGYEGAPGGGAAEHIVMGMLQLPFPIFDLNRAARARTTAEREVAEVEQHNLEVVLATRLERLRTEVEISAQRIDALRERVLPNIETNLAMLQRAYELGDYDVLQVSVGIERLLATRAEALDAYRRHFDALAMLQAAVGSDLSEAP